MTVLLAPVQPCTCSDFELPHQHCVIHGVYVDEICLECEEESRDAAPDEYEDICECGRRPEDCRTIDGPFSHGDREDPTADYDADAKGMD